jgi:hypothetical protein
VPVFNCTYKETIAAQGFLESRECRRAPAMHRCVPSHTCVAMLAMRVREVHDEFGVNTSLSGKMSF